MRRKRAEKRERMPDPRYNDVLVGRFINSIMRDGKKIKAQTILYDAFSIIEEKTKGEPLEVFRKAINNVQPGIEVRSRRVGGSNYQIPSEVRPDRRIALAIKWLLTYSRARNEKSMSLRLANELMAASVGEGASVKKREDVHKMAEANKAFAHFKW
ncbi:30S ribosomal protein S7 [Ignavibacteria bacterium CHB1]|nr:MAG: 30S ribosomal protein S7 [Chlorobiota bacterium]MBV6398423.1 30S ribosomal protein S7 [Ignavibacteria bacterium]MCC6885985.1 30S ribosomal protein S7 [Ignavibacteriales bacterium]MCE7952765.1 30S ribosomal protein S7 [Chlorobi bacterium CHB7]MDL1886875.1 30S ribosomal protein S7 [Ignavibacteria bacterium CHB1]RIK50398.1 MAG: 30S ribosomal protein S7 [Ignavibacteriota bacterium]